MYRSLDPDRIAETARVLEKRVGERFPESSLSRVADEVRAVSEQGGEMARWLAHPNLLIRAAVALCVTVLLGAAVTAVIQLNLRLTVTNVFELFQGLEALINDAVFVAIAIFFLASWETRIKRRRALRALHELRSLAHVIDMHQLTKDPERLTSRAQDTSSSPERTMTAFELTRYLDYCSEMLAIVAKVGAVYIGGFADSVTLAAVTEIENLCTGLSRKIWQKIVILDRVAGRV